ncbi:HAMP domain-containing histidine kinase [bacterium]|nr:HAMP domain-containing histidine kinase [bacterium]
MGSIRRIALERELDERLRWLIFIRWFAAAGVFFVVLGTRYLLKIELDLLSLFIGNAILLAYNSGLNFINKKLIRRRGQPDWFPMATRIAKLQISTDLFLLAYFIHFSGGLENPFIFYFIFHMVIASMLLSNRAAYFQATLAVFLLTAIAVMECTGILRHHHLEGFFPYPSSPLSPQYFIGVLIIIASTLYITVFLATSIVNRLRKGERSLLLANERLSIQDKMKSEYVKKVSHDIQSSLSTIQICLQVVQDGNTGPVSDNALQMISRAENRCELLNKFVKDLLNLSSIRARKHLKTQTILLKNIIERSIEQNQILAINKNLSLKANIGQNNWVKVNAMDIEELLMNLINNAIRYTPSGGKIMIRTESISETDILVSITDTGIGISPDELSDIFRDFYRAGNAKSFEKSGTGLGLSIAKQIVQSHGGRIWAENRIEKGTTFYFTLPKAEEAPPKFLG